MHWGGKGWNPPRQRGIGKEQARMQYLVTEELIDPGPLLPPDQLVGIMRQFVLPSMDALINLQSEGKIVAGGVRVGERALVLIFEAESNEELDSILQRLPLWGLGKWKVTPLENLEGRTARDRRFIEQLEQSLRR
jgi:muconolactone delta-isomerase